MFCFVFVCLFVCCCCCFYFLFFFSYLFFFCCCCFFFLLFFFVLFCFVLFCFFIRVFYSCVSCVCVCIFFFFFFFVVVVVVVVCLIYILFIYLFICIFILLLFFVRNEFCISLLQSSRETQGHNYVKLSTKGCHSRRMGKVTIWIFCSKLHVWLYTQLWLIALLPASLFNCKTVNRSWD